MKSNKEIKQIHHLNSLEEDLIEQNENHFSAASTAAGARLSQPDSLCKHFQIVLLKERGKPCRDLSRPDSCDQNGQSSSGEDKGPHEASAHDEMNIDKFPWDNEWNTVESRQKGP